jgi:hypothetical protein
MPGKTFIPINCCILLKEDVPVVLKATPRGGFFVG